MPFFALFIGMFIGSLSALFVFFQAEGSLFSIVAYLGLILLSVTVLAFLSVLAPRSSFAGAPGRVKGWSRRLDAMAQQAKSPTAVCVFTSVRRASI